MMQSSLTFPPGWNSQFSLQWNKNKMYSRGEKNVRLFKIQAQNSFCPDRGPLCIAEAVDTSTYSQQEKDPGLEQQTSAFKAFFCILEKLKTVSISSLMNLSKCCSNSPAVRDFTGPEMLTATRPVSLLHRFLSEKQLLYWCTLLFISQCCTSF